MTPLAPENTMFGTSTMSNAPGSAATACWTCKVRHVRCDFNHPACKQCTKRQVKCHGFGPRPAWMDGGPEEAKERAQIKSAVRKNFSALRTSQNRARRKSVRPSLAAADPDPEIANARLDSSHPRARGHRTTTSPDDRGVNTAYETTRAAGQRNDHSIDFENYHSGVATSPRQGLSTGNGTPQFDLHEASLLMHYLDHVFIWQFPYYDRNSHLGDRGWLLALFSKRGPLYHAAMSLSALHKSWQSGHSREFQANQKAFNHRSKALRELCHLLAEEKAELLLQDDTQLAEFLACSVLLISFEVFNGGDRDWCLHLDAITSLISSRAPKPFIPGALSPNIQQQNSPQTDPYPSEDTNMVGLGFLFVDVLWFDLFACVSVERVPRLPYRSWLDVPGFNMADIMGCQNWVMHAIGDIAVLRDWKANRQMDGDLSVFELARRGQQIQSQLEEGLKDLEICESNAKVGQITKLFALASLVWLYTVVSGPQPTLPEMRAAVARGIEAIVQVKDAFTLRGAVWALCILGCMAEEESQPFFSDLLTGLIEESGRFGNSSSVLRIVKESWARQRDHGGQGLAVKDSFSALLI
ncbi:Trichothecene biosynthesis transcription regulator TRI10 [Paramyrothecium foliicola]|nr:Trichothecene biosynthesis transcription regulator TRI10 [Paramyrothecium foliicola]